MYRRYRRDIAITHVCSERDIVPPSTEQDTESHISVKMMTTMEVEVSMQGDLHTRDTRY